MQAQGQGHNRKSMAAAIYKTLIKVVLDSSAFVQKVTIFWYVKNSSKLIYFHKNNRALPCFLKSY